MRRVTHVKPPHDSLLGLGGGGILSPKGARLSSLSARMRKKLLEKCSSGNLRGLQLIVDWSDAQIKGLQLAIGNEKAEMLLKGCKVHWIRSCQRVAEKVAFSCDRQKERTLFVHVARQIPLFTNAISVVACFETLCGLRQCQILQKEFAVPKMQNLLMKAVIGLLQSIGLNGGQDLHT